MTRPERRGILALLVAIFLVHLWLGGRLGLSEDEAYYWVFSRHLAAGYLDHPPLIAWTIRASTAVLGDTQLGVRAGTALLGSLGLLPVILLARHRVLAALALVSAPLLWLGGVLATPDVPLVAAWSLGLWAMARRRWILLGVAAGLAMLSKYTGLLLLPLALLADPRCLRERGPWRAAAVAFLVYLPNAWWNVENDLSSWRFQLEHLSGQGAAAGAGSMAFIGSQAGLVGPVIFLAAIAWWARGLPAAFRFGERDAAARIDRLCWWSSLPVLIIASISGGEANWGAVAWLGTIVGLARMAGRWPRVLGFGAGVSGLVSLAVTVHAVHPMISWEADPLHRLEGGQILADSVAAWDIQTVWTSRYQEAALIHFYSGIPAHALPGQGRLDQYDLWPASVADPTAHALFVRPWRGDSEIPLDHLPSSGQHWQRSGPNTVTAYAATPDPTVSIPVARWQVFELWQQQQQQQP